MQRRDKTIVIVGAGGHGREVLGIFLDRGEAEEQVAGFVDDSPHLQGAVVDGKRVLGDVAWLLERAQQFLVVVAIGANDVRRTIAKRLGQAGCEFATAVSPHAVLSPFTTVGAGSMVCAAVVVTSGARIGEHVILNLGSTVSHDCQVGDFVHAACGVHIAGGARVSEGAELGTAASVNPGTWVGAWSVVGAGAVVVRDLGGSLVAVGLPARPIGKVGCVESPFADPSDNC